MGLNERLERFDKWLYSEQVVLASMLIRAGLLSTFAWGAVLSEWLPRFDGAERVFMIVVLILLHAVLLHLEINRITEWHRKHRTARESGSENANRSS